MEQPANSNLFDLQLDQTCINYLNEASRWSRFLSILGFIYCGLMLIAGVFVGSIMSRLPGLNGDNSAMQMMGTGVFGFIFFCHLHDFRVRPSFTQCIHSQPLT